MGNGSFDPTTYTARQTATKAAGYSTSFRHTEDIRSGKVAAAAHESVDPLKKNNNGPFKDTNIREAADSDEHPNSTPIMVFFDVTGSMGQIPMTLQKKLPGLHGLLQRKGYVEDPQLCFGAIGDANSDRVPLQVGQFESDNKGDEQLEELYLEGNGGGQTMETYELALAFALTKTHIDSFEKRGQKGYLFTMGDEGYYDEVKGTYYNRTLEQLLGPDHGLETPIKTSEIVKALSEKWEYFHIYIPSSRGGSFGYVADGAQHKQWQALLGERCLLLEDPNGVNELIGLTLGILEGGTSIEDGMEDLKDAGGDLGSIAAAGKALATIGANTVAPAKASGSLPATTDTSAADRL